MARAQWRKFEDRIIAAIEKAEIAHELLTLSTNSKRTLFLLLQELSEQLGFMDDPRGWPASPEKRQEAARSRVVGGVDLLTNRPIQNEQELHAVWASKNDPETIDLIGRAATGKLLVGAFRFIVEVYFRTWSKTPDSHYENFAESVGIIKSLVIAECRALWRGRLFAREKNEARSDMNPPASKDLPWFDRMPRADVAAELEDEADRWSKRAREFELRRYAESAAESSSEPTATDTAAATEVSEVLSADKPKPHRRREKRSRQPDSDETPEQRSQRRKAVVCPVLKDLGWTRGRLVTEAGLDSNGPVYGFLDGTRKTIHGEHRQDIEAAIKHGLKEEKITLPSEFVLPD